MIAFLKQLIDSAIFMVNHFVEMLLFVPRMLGMLVESVSLVTTSIYAAPVFIYPILAMILAVAIIMWLVNLL